MGNGQGRLGFEDFNLKPELLKGLQEAGLSSASPIQQQSLLAIFAGKSLLAKATNGNGRTEAFVIALLEKCHSTKNAIQGLVLVPTSELASQASNVLGLLGKYMDLKSMVAKGGTSIRDDVCRLSSDVHILIATPGRLLDLASEDACNLNRCQLIVMDEADRFFCPELLPILEDIVKFLPSQSRQFLMYSATYPSAMVHFKNCHLTDAHEVNFKEQMTLNGVSQFYICVEENRKVFCLTKALSTFQINQVIIFCNSVTRVKLLARKMTHLGYPCLFFHPGLFQSERQQVLQDAWSGACQTMVCSSHFMRGIEMQSVNVVINFDFPRGPQTYLHRTGRFSRLGLAVSFVTQRDRIDLLRLQKAIGTKILPMPAAIDPAIYT
eukprot:Skav220603  [mRNA]  locus=scaffold507:52444:64463:+ [translate_table: standard]